MQEAKIDAPLINGSRIELHKMFLHCIFSNPNFLKGEIAKNMEVPIENVTLKHNADVMDDNGEVKHSIYNLSIYDANFVLTFEKKVEKPRVIEVPKVVFAPKKWYQSKPERTVVVEKRETKEITHWVLNSID